MRKWKLLTALAGLLGVIFAAGAVVLWPRGQRITRRDFDRIKIGMTKPQVEAILGQPGDYTTGPMVADIHEKLPPLLLQETEDLADLPEVLRRKRLAAISEDQHRRLYAAKLPYSEWAGDDGTIVAYFDSELVWVCYFRPNARVNQSVFDMLIWRANRQWDRWFP